MCDVWFGFLVRSVIVFWFAADLVLIFVCGLIVACLWFVGCLWVCCWVACLVWCGFGVVIGFGRFFIWLFLLLVGFLGLGLDGVAVCR